MLENRFCRKVYNVLSEYIFFFYRVCTVSRPIIDIFRITQSHRSSTWIHSEQHSWCLGYRVSLLCYYTERMLNTHSTSLMSACGVLLRRWAKMDRRLGTSYCYSRQCVVHLVQQQIVHKLKNGTNYVHMKFNRPKFYSRVAFRPLFNVMCFVSCFHSDETLSW